MRSVGEEEVGGGVGMRMGMIGRDRRGGGARGGGVGAEGRAIQVLMLLLLVVSVEICWIGVRCSWGEAVESRGRSGIDVSGEGGRGKGLRHAVDALLVGLVLVGGELIVG